ncbi:unnamed protein product [Lactuca virosa]|uniref:Uncharacterized protein n=1 Tax=Lactuca virosa TaxID=75947 RepID=A0AAU9M0S8_9ASTR|nr:unnamed protein product [Lactuca virosa]
MVVASFYFKQQDSKNLNIKSLVSEIKEIKGKNSEKGILVNGDSTLVKEDELQVQTEKEGGREATTRPSNATENGHEAKSNIHEVPVSQHIDSGIRCTRMGNGNPGESSKVEKEEGQLSPNHDSDEVNFSTYKDNENENGTYKGEMEVDCDDEESDVVSGGGDDISGDESGGSREEEEEECKPESKGEGNGIENSSEVSLPWGGRYKFWYSFLGMEHMSDNCSLGRTAKLYLLSWEGAYRMAEVAREWMRLDLNG